MCRRGCSKRQAPSACARTWSASAFTGSACSTTRARVALQAGYPTVVDAAFLKRAERDRFRGLAQALAVPFTLLACEAAPEELRDRVMRRSQQRDDASEAGVAVLERLMQTAEPLHADERLHTIEVHT